MNDAAIPATQLQAAVARLFADVEAAGAELNDRQYAAFIEIGYRRFANAIVELELDAWRAAA